MEDRDSETNAEENRRSKTHTNRASEHLVLPWFPDPSLELKSLFHSLASLAI